MFNMSNEVLLPVYALIAVVGLVLLITRFRIHPFIALTLAALFLGLVAGMPVAKVVKSFQTGFGGVVGFVGIVLGLGTMLGKMMAESGGADQIAKALLGAFGKERVHWAMMFVAFIVGIPLFFEIGFVLLIPLVFIMARRVDMPWSRSPSRCSPASRWCTGSCRRTRAHCWRSASSAPTSARPFSTG
jgi:GntP family gluconate:H+ symporter